jgi:outer membrane protein assembly factor BamD (BamD/ComL family)
MIRSRLWILAFLMVATACHRHAGIAATPTAPVAPAVVNAVPAALKEADSAYERGDYVNAAKSYETYLQSNPPTDEMDRVLFRTGVAQTLSGTAAGESASNGTFKQLLTDYPNSPYAPPSQLVLALETDIQHLQADQKFRDDQIRQLTALVPPPPPPVPAVLMDAESAFDSGDYVKAAKSYETYLQSNPQTDEKDRILFRYGTALMLSGVAARETVGDDTFKRLITEFPNSPYAPHARKVLQLRTDIATLKSDVKSKDEKIQKLNDELNNVKKIDSQRRRTP